MGNSTEIGTARKYKNYRRPYKVRKFATDSKSQKSSFSQLGPAIQCATKCGMNVYKVIYSENDKPINIELVWENPLSKINKIKIKKKYSTPTVTPCVLDNNSILGESIHEDNSHSTESVNGSGIILVPVNKKDNLFKRLFNKIFRRGIKWQEK